MTATIINMKAQQGFIDRHSDGLTKAVSSTSCLVVGGAIAGGLWWAGSTLLAMSGAWGIVGAILIVFAAFQALGTLLGFFGILLA